MKKRFALFLGTIAVAALLMAAGNSPVPRAPGLASFGNHSRQASPYTSLLKDYGTGKTLLIQNTTTPPHPDGYSVTAQDVMLVRTIRLTLLSGSSVNLVAGTTQPEVYLSSSVAGNTLEFNVDPPMPLVEGMSIHFNTNGFALCEFQGSHITSPFNGGDMMVVR